MTLLPFEIWKDIPGYEGMYQASSMGRIRNVKTKKIRKIGYNSHTDMCVVMLIKNSHYRCEKVHRLIGLTFIPNPNNYQCINHKDEDRSNNQVSNLEWCTHKYNNNYGSRNIRVSEKHSRPVKQLTTDGILIRYWVSGIEVERRLGFARQNVWKCCKNESKTAYGYKWEFADEK